MAMASLTLNDSYFTEDKLPKTWRKQRGLLGHIAAQD